VLRMHTLALIASKFCSSMEELLSFYEKTFYAHQFGEMSEVEQKIEKVVGTLEDYDFVDTEEFEATEIGRKVSDLYIDPDSAHLILKGLERAEGSETRDISYLFMLARTSELSPKLNVKDKEWSEYERMLNDAEPYLLEETPQEWDLEYERFMDSMKTAMMMNAWISEMEEEEIMNEFGIAPGGIRSKIQNADWLLYSSKELARMKGLDVDSELEKLRIRLKHGIDEELLNLVKYDQIGRVRARKLYDHGIENKKDIKQVSFEKLKKLIGKKTAGLLKEQVGEENYFDREDVTSYFN
jgi:helicase